MTRPEPDATPTQGVRSRLGRRRDRVLAVGWLVVAWNLFWGDFSWANLLGGMLVAAAVVLFFPLPPVTFDGRLRLRGLLVFTVRFVSELIRASLHVARIAVQPGYVPRSAIVAVRLRVPTDLNLALTAEVLSLVPGTLIVETDRQAAVLYVHVLDVHGPADLVAARRQVRVVERRIVAAVGSNAELRQVLSVPVDKELS
ncbi:Na+/H+ antiporter subunit E [Micromonospora fiedleri]|uniref:Na+/H+ antiporter subunit E n=1 Tax=Micromonospora fiedleri TaxID=1157498 RepID=A0ABS1UEI6_9ACTN|nr:MULTISPECIES: Na+/H+ antiporter subunit E [Micromonospora]MBL6274760.1 Na+/H+ antiporter subunit E [Micromonospora fiedleri]WSK44533.1 Na+/H+ antiporter subunit E [Micromonospora maris]